MICPDCGTDNLAWVDSCEECGQDIGMERLRARPVTTLCIDCKSLQEAQERKIRTS